MLNIIIPLAGTGSRFLQEGYLRPKPFVKALGKELVLWLLEHLTLRSTDAIVIVFNKNPDIGPSPAQYYRIVDEYMSTLGTLKPEIIYVTLDKPTSGAAETALHGIEALPPERLDLPAVLLDGDTFYTADVLGIAREKLRSATSKNVFPDGCLFVFDDDKPTESQYSYVNMDGDSDTVTKIMEKDKTGMSPFACCGCYCFRVTQALQMEISSALEVHQSENPGFKRVKQELYTSSIVARMLKAGCNFIACKLNSSEFTILGTPSQLRTFIVSSKRQIVKRFCFDLDNTLVTSPSIHGDYASCRPIESVIQYVQTLHASGHYIIIHTARRMRTHGGNVGCVVADVGALTIQQLKHFCIPYHELVFGKPFADFYIDDRSVSAFVDELHKETGFIFEK